MRKYFFFLPLMFLFEATSASAISLHTPLGLTTQFPNLNTQDLEVTFDDQSGEVLLEAGSSTTALLTEFNGDSGTLYLPNSFSYKLSGNVNALSAIDFSASTPDNKVNLTGAVVAFGSGIDNLEFLVDVVSTGTVDFGSMLGIIVTDINSSLPQADSFSVPVPATVWLFATGLLGLVARRAKNTL